MLPAHRNGELVIVIDTDCSDPRAAAPPGGYYPAVPAGATVLTGVAVPAAAGGDMLGAADELVVGELPVAGVMLGAGAMVAGADMPGVAATVAVGKALGVAAGAEDARPGADGLGAWLAGGVATEAACRPD